jgi:hypothetical protein
LRVEFRLLEVERGLGGFAGSDALRPGITEARNPRRDRILRALDPKTRV